MTIKNTYEDENGYLRFIDSNKLFHRWVMERKLNRSLRPGEIVHHINGNRQDNSDQNLVVLTKEQHYQLHIAPLLEARKEAQITEKLTTKIEAQTINIIIVASALLGAFLIILGIITGTKIAIWYLGLLFLLSSAISWFVYWMSKSKTKPKTGKSTEGKEQAGTSR